MKNILLSGSLTYDYIMSIPESFSDHILPDHLDKLNLSLVANTLRKTRGGTAGNIGYTMSLLQTPSTIISAVGSDGREYLDYLEKRNINSSYIGLDKNSLTSSVYIVSDKRGSQISTYYGGIDPKLTPHISIPKGRFAYAIVSPSDNVSRHMRECATLEMKSIFDPGQNSTSLSREEFREFINKTEIFISNEYEAEVMLEKTGWTMTEVLEKVALVIITKGEKGSELLLNDGGSLSIPPCKPKRVLDPSGAGDAYRGGLLAGLARGLDLQTCAQMGSVAGTYCVESYGCQEHQYTLAEFCARYKETYKKEIIISEGRNPSTH